jgi:uncharacterized membrane protein
MGWLGMARAPGGKAGADPPSVHRDTSRLVTFSDAVFAISITLLILEIRPPTDDRNLLHGLLVLWPSYLAYAVTFLFIGQVWANHHVMFDHVHAADRVVLLLNTLLLMVVAFLPFATSVLAGAFRSGHGQRTAVVFYGIAFDVTALTFKCRLAVRMSSRAAQRSPRPCRRNSNQPALSTRAGLADDWRRAWRRAARSGCGRHRRLQRLLLAPDPGRESPSTTLLRGTSSPARATLTPDGVAGGCTPLGSCVTMHATSLLVHVRARIAETATDARRWVTLNSS